MAGPRFAVVISIGAVATGAVAMGAALAVGHFRPHGDVVDDRLAIAGAGTLAVWLLWMAVLVPAQRQFRGFATRLIGRAEAGGREPVPAPIWLRPLARTLARCVDAWADRCDQLQSAVREIEIRHRVAESERQRTEMILHSLRDAVIVTDNFDEITMANAAAEKLFGFELQGTVGRSIDTLLRSDELPAIIRGVRAAGIANKQKHVEHQLAPSGPEAAAENFDVTLVCIPDATQGVAGVVTILRNITREKEISQMKSDFVSQASHELRTPLSSINAYVEMLIDGEATDEESRHEFYQIIRAESERVSRMVDNMLNISRIEAGIVSADWCEVDFVKVCEDVVETLMPQARLKRIGLSVKSGPLVYSAQADRDMVHQVVMNLVSNGIKYTPEGGRVTVAVENDDTTRSVLVTVADTGLGIPPDARERIFDKFFRVKSYQRVAQGTGLGLNLVRRIVETVHHGQVGLESEVGMGSKFWFSVPYRNEGLGVRSTAA